MEEIDRLSSLPDSLLLHILSFLPTETCVKTISLVSQRYLHLWQDLHVLDFYQDYRKQADDQAEIFRKFAVFVNGVFTCRKSLNVGKFSLSCGFSKDTEEFLHKWISTAIGPHLEELHLAIFSDEQDYAFSLDLNILSLCPNLVSLSLCGDISPYLELSSAVCLPSLKKLLLDFANVDVAEPFVNALLSSCPILETLEVSMSVDSLITHRVPPSLKKLKFTVDNDVGACLEIDTPHLKYLSLSRITFEGNAIGNLHNVNEAYLDVFSPHGRTASVDRLLNLLQALSRIKHLILSCSTTKWLFGTPHKNFRYPEFRHLLHLELILPCFNLKFMFSMLQNCPMLQVLIVQDDKILSQLPFGWTTQPISVPNCLVYHLTFIHIKRYQGYSDEKFARYVLRNGLVLKTMRISGLSLHLMEKWEKHRILRKFSNAPRGSVSCQLQFD